MTTKKDYKNKFCERYKNLPEYDNRSWLSIEKKLYKMRKNALL